MPAPAASDVPGSTLARVVAAFADGFVIAVLAVVSVLTIRALGVDTSSSTYAWVAVAIGTALEVGLTAWRGQTVGKVLLGLVVVDAAGAPPSFRVSALRFAARTLFPANLLLERVPIVAGVIGFYPLALLLSIATHDERRGWHDRAAGTWVCYIAERSPLPHRIGPMTNVDLIPIEEPPSGNPRKHRRRR